jgi:hypothetical protein
VDGAAGAAGAVNTGIGGGEQTLDLAELGVGALELGGAAGEGVEAVVIADGHLVGEAAEIPGERGDVLGELDALAAELGEGAADGGGIGGGAHGQCPVSIGSSPLMSSLTSLACCLPVVLFSFWRDWALVFLWTGGGALTALTSLASLASSLAEL